MILFLAIFSNSRSGLLIILLQFATFIGLNQTKGRISSKRLKNIIFVVMTSIIMLPFAIYYLSNSEFVQKRMDSYNFVKNYKASQSNKTRLGTYVASLEAFKEKPVLGHGFGQAGFTVVNKYPDWSREDNIELERFVQGKKIFPPVYNTYIRVGVDTGLLGLITFVAFQLVVFLRSLLLYYRGKVLYGQENLNALLVLSSIGFGLTWVQFDTFRVIGYWIFFSFFLVVLNKAGNK
ncbi:O-antigen ligase family protein [Muricauda sp. 334s03]|uniref:O-antigen ligase family protein n=1 Tax=Flagellimonas yonaguniensis TaxID=3031325 RepID=A0ABT5XUB7_9FLAO|nr:O-antigen ligase family protein [[Muricauda] yonaguniensis]MDF0714769.1 O-antigen ligase family protein [[Muricauda] yonaguniensis]